MSEITVGGVGLCAEFGLILLEESQFNPPKAKTYLLDLPGGDGALDVTEAFGDVFYGNRNDTIILAVADPAVDFEQLKTRFAGFLHGRSYDYQLAFDPGYTYHGRFSVDEAYQRMHHRQLKVTVSANPYKSAGTRTVEVDAQAGAHVTLSPGRGRVSPVFESQMPVHVISNGVDAMLPAGSHRAVGLSIRAGQSDVYVNTGGSIRGGSTEWGDLKDQAWGGLGSKRWHEAMWQEAPPAPSEYYRVRISYEVKEL